MTVPDEPTLRAILELAGRAPSIHNTQPWSWSLRDGALILRADSHRRLPQTDPVERDLLVSCGAVLHELTVSAAAAGWKTTVRRTAADLDGQVLATIAFTPHEPTPDDLRNASAIVQRRTDRRQVSSWPVPAARLDRLRALAERHGVVATVIPDHLRPLLRRTLAQARDVQRLDARFLDELLSWTGGTADGVPVANRLDQDLTHSVPPSYTRFPTGSLADTYADVAPPSPEWLVLTTASDDRDAWLRTGEALDAMWLSCTISGLSLVPYTQPIEVGATRETLRRGLFEDEACPQVVLRVGWPQHHQPPLPATPRRPVADVLHDDLVRLA